MKQPDFKIVLGAVLCLSLGCVSLSCGRAKAAIFSQKAYEYHNRGEFDKAIEMYEKLISLEPKNPVNYWDLAVAYVDMKDYENARVQAGKVRELDIQLGDEIDLMIRQSSRGVMYTGRHLRRIGHEE